MKIAIFPNLKKKNAKECTKKVCEYFNEFGVQLYIDFCYIDDFSELKYLNFGDFSQFINECELVTVIGGDGTIIQCSHKISSTQIPIFAVNSGRLGFMAGIESDEIYLLENIVKRNFSLVDRMMICGKIFRENGEIMEIEALNEIIVSKGINCKLADFRVSVNGALVSALRADGLIFSTPTGSTAYSLSAGGPIIEPSVECIEFTQICPFSLSARTMLFSSEKVIKVNFKTNSSVSAIVSNDGIEKIELGQNDELLIYKSKKSVKFADISSDGFYHSINDKLMQPFKYDN